MKKLLKKIHREKRNRRMTWIMLIRWSLLKRKRSKRNKMKKMSIVILKSWKRRAMTCWRKCFSSRSTSQPMKMNNKWSKIPLR